MTEKTNDVFISYSSKDSQAAEQLLAILEAAGLKCWIALRDIPQGVKWAAEIDAAIRRTRAFVVLVSKNSIESPQVSKELGLAVTDCPYMIPVRIDQAPLNGTFRYYLSDCQWLEACTDQEARFEELAEMLCRRMGIEGEDPIVRKQEKLAGRNREKPESLEGKWPGSLSSRGRRYVLAAAAIAVFLGVGGGLGKLAGNGGLNSGPAGKNQSGSAVTDNGGEVMAAGAPDHGVGSDQEGGEGGFSEETRSQKQGKLSVDVQKEDIGTLAVLLQANEEVSAREYYEALDRVKQRLDCYFGAGTYELEEERDKVLLKIPVDRLGTYEPEYLLQTGITRPTELYLTTEEEKKPLLIARKDLESVTLIDGRVSAWDLSEYGLTPEETYEYFELKLSPERAKEVWEVYRQFPDSCVLAQDMEGYEMWYYYPHLEIDDEGKTIRFLNSDFDPQINRLILFNLQNPCFAKAFNFTISVPAIWEKADQAAVRGQYQCSADQMSGVTVDVIYQQGIEEEKSYGNWYDFCSALKERLDMLEVPYAAGRLNYDAYGVVIRIGSEKVNEEILKLLGGNGSSLQLYGKKKYLYSSAVKQLEIGTKEDGRTYVECIPDPDYYDQENIRQFIAENEGSWLWLCVDSTPILTGTVTDGRLYFDSCAYGEPGVISEKYQYLLSLLERIGFQNDRRIGYYSLKNIRFTFHSADDLEQNQDFELNQVRNKQNEKKARQMAQELHRELGVEASVYLTKDNICHLYLPLEVNDSFPEQVAALASEVRQKHHLDDGSYQNVIISFTEEPGEERARVWFFRSPLCDDGFYRGWAFDGERILPYKEETETLLRADEFWRRQESE